jgi:hypothetical protein
MRLSLLMLVMSLTQMPPFMPFRASVAPLML